MNKTTTIILIYTLLFSASHALANEVYVCTHGDQKRIITVVYANEDSPIPCEVIYTKMSGDQSLWHAENQEGYCEKKAELFVEKQRSWGWMCTKQESDDNYTNEVEKTGSIVDSYANEVEKTGSIVDSYTN